LSASGIMLRISRRILSGVTKPPTFVILTGQRKNINRYLLCGATVPGMCGRYRRTTHEAGISSQPTSVPPTGCIVETSGLRDHTSDIGVQSPFRVLFNAA